MYPLPNKNENFPQQNKNRAALRALRALGYPLPRIRHALVILNGRKITDINGSGVGKTVIYNAVKGKTHHYPAMKAVAQALGLHVEELFDEGPGAFSPKGPTCSAAPKQANLEDPHNAKEIICQR